MNQQKLLKQKQKQKIALNQKKFIVEKIITDFEYLLKAFKKLSESAAKEGDKGTEAFADEKVAKFEKDLWMLGNMVK